LELRPAALTKTELGDLLRQLTEAIASRSGVPVTLTTEGECVLPPDVRIALYRIAQEALSNVRRHAQSPKLRVEIMRSEQALDLLFQDWGVGFDIPSKRGQCQCIGLVSMRERASLIGGLWQIDSAPGAGTIVRVSLPLLEN